MTQAYPLLWPHGWPRTARPDKSLFRTTLSAAIKNVQGSLDAFTRDSGKKIENLMISSNVTLMAANPKDCGVAVYFTWDGISTCIAVDRYNKLEDNLQAIHHVIEAERTKLRHGGLNLVKAGFRGYAALPPPRSNKNWWDVLGVRSDANSAEVQKAYIQKAKELHPDNGGSDTAMAELNAARAEALSNI